MKCPHCNVEMHDVPRTWKIGEDGKGHWAALTQRCPGCHEFIVVLVRANSISRFDVGDHTVGKQVRVLGYPRAASRPKPPPEVIGTFAEDFNEAALVLADSPKASAALSRRCMQQILRDKAGVKPTDLASEIDEVLAMGVLPTGIAEGLDVVRQIGNFAAHPIKSQHTGEIVQVEPGEAEWNLDVLEGLFDVFFVQPARLAARKAALNVKLKAAGKPPLP